MDEIIKTEVKEGTVYSVGKLDPFKNTNLAIANNGKVYLGCMINSSFNKLELTVDEAKEIQQLLNSVLA